MTIRTAIQYNVTAVFLASIVLAGCSSGSGDGLDDNGQPVADTGDEVADAGDDVADAGDDVADAGDAGDAGDDIETPDETPPPVVSSAFGTIQTTIFTAICTECHGAGFGAAGLSLDEAGSFGNIVGVPSSQVPTLSRIEPGDPDNSYLVQKIQGIAAFGGQMPLGGPPLSQEDMDLIIQWVADGALPDTPAALAFAPKVVSASIEQDATLDRMPSTMTIVWTSPIDGSTFTDATVSLLSSGGDGTFSDGNETEIGVTVGDVNNPFVTTLFTNDQKPDGDTFQLRIAGEGDIYARAVDASAIDGNGDGVAGGNFIRSFTIE